MVKVWIRLGRTPSATKPASACPVCTKPEVTNPGTVVTAIVAEVRRNGQLEANSSVKFWQRFRSELCSDCASLLQFCSQANHIAERHFREAIRMDPNHPSAKPGEPGANPRIVHSGTPGSEAEIVDVGPATANEE